MDNYIFSERSPMESIHSKKYICFLFVAVLWVALRLLRTLGLPFIGVSLSWRFGAVLLLLLFLLLFFDQVRGRSWKNIEHRNVLRGLSLFLSFLVIAELFLENEV